MKLGVYGHRFFFFEALCHDSPRDALPASSKGAEEAKKHVRFDDKAKILQLTKIARSIVKKRRQQKAEDEDAEEALAIGRLVSSYNTELLHHAGEARTGRLQVT